MQQIDKDSLDVYCVYCPDTDECYYLDPKVYNRSVTLRVNSPRNNQAKNVKLAADYRGVP
jgi:hypothetical protein